MKKEVKVFWSRLMLLAFSLTMVVSFTVSSAGAYEFNVGGWEGRLDAKAVYTVGTRANEPRSAEEVNANLHSFQGNLYPNQRDHIYDDQWDIYTSVLKINPELSLTKDNYGFFTRASFYYDTTIMNTNTNLDSYGVSPNPNTWDGLINWQDGLNQGNSDWTDDTEDNQGLGVELYDAYVFADYEVDNFLGMGYAPITLRLGQQAFNWGEGSFYLDGINTSNALDVSKLMAPGLDMREATLPVPAVMAQIGLFDSLAFEAYYQFAWKEHRFPNAGTFYHTDDDLLGPGHNGLYYDVGTLLSFPNESNPLLGGPDGSFGDLPGVINGDHAAYTRVIAKKTTDADDQGQYGLSARYSLGNYELGAYFINYHHQAPYFRFHPSSGGFAGDGVIEFVYPEDQKLYALSVATQVGKWAVAAEAVYQPDHPMWFGDPLTLAFDNYTQTPVELNGTTYDTATESFDAFIKTDIYHGQVNLLRAFGAGLGFDSSFLILAASVDHVPSANGTPGDFANGVDAYTLQGNGNGHAPTDEWAWGYNVEYDLTKFNAFGVNGLTVTPGFGWQHAVDGYSRMWGNWWEGKKWLQARCSANYGDFTYKVDYTAIRHDDKLEASDYEDHADTLNLTVTYEF